jgi:hypothetical protein
MSDVTLTNCAVSSASGDITDTGLSLTQSDCQFSWVPPAWPVWNALPEYFLWTTLTGDVASPPQAGNPPYTGYEKGLFGEDRIGIGAVYFDLTPTVSYADLDLPGEGGDGSDGDPWCHDTFKTKAYHHLNAGSTIRVRGQGEYLSTSFQLASILIAGVEGKVNLESWGTSAFRIYAQNGMYFHGDSNRGILQSPSSIPFYESNLIDTYAKSGDLISFGDSNIAKGCTFITPTLSGGSHAALDAKDTIFSYTYYITIATFTTDKCLFKSAVPAGTHTDYQDNWIPPAWPDWNDSQSSFSSNILSGVNTPPEPGYEPYTGYEYGLFGEPRTGIGALYFEPAVGMYIDLKDYSTGVPDEWLWEILNRDTALYEPIGTTSEILNHFFNLLDTRYALHTEDQYQWELRLTVANEGGSDARTRTFIIVVPS